MPVETGFYSQQTPWSSLADSFGSGMRMGDMIKDRKEKNRVAAENEAVRKAYEASVTTGPDGQPVQDEKVFMSTLLKTAPHMVTKMQNEFAAAKAAREKTASEGLENKAQTDWYTAQAEYLRGGKGEDTKLAAQGLKRDPITGNIVPDFQSPIFQANAKKAEIQQQEAMAKIANMGFKIDQNGSLVADPTSPAYQKIMSEVGVNKARAKGIGVGGMAKSAKITAEQRKAATFAQRLEDSEKDLGAAMQSFDPTSMYQVYKDKLTPEGMRGTGAKQFNQARNNFINAVLRRESGAAIAQSEYDNADRQYFPVEGDTPPVIAQKARNRAVALAGLQAEAGTASEGVKAQLSQAGSKPAAQTKTINGVLYQKVKGGWQRVK